VNQNICDVGIWLAYNEDGMGGLERVNATFHRRVKDDTIFVVVFVKPIVQI